MSEPIASPFCTIPVNPDIAGVGVRAAIYAQNLLCLLSALWALWDGKVTPGKLDYAETQTTTNLILAFAILISTIVQAYTLGISNYHTNIVLSMSWMNNTNAFVYFILYVQHKIGLEERDGGVAPTWRAWVKHVKSSLSFTLGGTSGGETEAGATLTDITTSSGRAKVLVKRFVLLLGSLHLTLMAALGIWLWTDLQLFGRGNQAPGDFKAADACAVNRVTVAILGRGVPFGSSTLRVTSLVVYSLFLIPGFNLIIPMILFLVIYFACRRLPVAKGWDVLPAYIGLGVLLVINVVFMVDIELTRGFNSILQGKDEAEFGFGQILSLLLLLLPLRDLAEAILARRLKQRQAELDEDLQEAIIREDFSGLKRAVDRGGTFPSPKSDRHGEFWTVVAANGELEYFDKRRRTRMANVEKALEVELHSAITAQNESRMTAAYNQGADLIAGVHQLPVEATGVVFWYAISKGLKQIACFYARQRGPHVTEPGPDGTTALMRALENDDEPLAKALLENPDIRVNDQDARGQTVLLRAAEHGQDEIVKMLIEQGDTLPNAADNDGWTPLLRASGRGHERIVEMLLEREDVQANVSNKEGWTPLMFASHNGYEGIVKILLDRPDIQLDVTTEDGKTARDLALENGNRNVAEMISKRSR